MISVSGKHFWNPRLCSGDYNLGITEEYVITSRISLVIKTEVHGDKMINGNKLLELTVMHHDNSYSCRCNFVILLIVVG